MSFNYDLPITEQHFVNFLKNNSKPLYEKYGKGSLPKDLQDSAYFKSLWGEPGEAFTPLTNSLYTECLIALKNGCFLLVFNSIFSLFELILIELILLAEARKFLLTENNKSADPKNTPLFQFIDRRRSDLENSSPNELLKQLHAYKIISDDEYIELKVIKKFIRLTTDHSKIKQFIRYLVAGGLMPAKVPIIEGYGDESLIKMLKHRIADKNVKQTEIPSDHEMVFQTHYTDSVKKIAHFLLAYYYDFILRKGKFSKL